MPYTARESRDGSFRTHCIALLASENSFDHKRDVLDLVFSFSSGCRTGSYLYLFASGHAIIVTRVIRSTKTTCKGRSHWKGRDADICCLIFVSS